MKLSHFLRLAFAAAANLNQASRQYTRAHQYHHTSSLTFSTLQL